MSSAPTLAQTEADSPDGWERALLDRQLERLDQLADMGMALAGEIQRRAAASAPDANLSHAAIDFARVSRAVRMTLALQSRLVRDFKTPIKAAAAEADDDDEDIRWEVEWLTTPPTVDEQRANVRRVMRGRAEDAGLDAETVQRLDSEARERLERDDIYADILNRPFDAIVARICEDLGLKSIGATSPACGGSDQSHAIDQDGPRSGGEGIPTQDGFDEAAEPLEMRHALSTTFGGPVRPSPSATALTPPAGEVASP